MENEGRLSFFKKIKYSIFDFEKYQNLAMQKIGNTIWYLCALMIILAILISGINTFKFIKMIEQTREYIQNNIEDIKFQNDELKIKMKNNEEVTKIENENLGFTIIIATNNKSEEVEKDFELLENGILISNNNIKIKNKVMSDSYNYDYKNISEIYNISYVDKNIILDILTIDKLMSFLIAFFLIIFVYMFTIYLSSTLIDILLLSIFGYLVSRITRINIKYKALYNMSVYSLTLPIILNMIYIILNSFTGFTIRYFDVMYTTVATIYISTAILLIRSDLIKKQIELTRIIEEQGKVREELKEKEEKQAEKDKDEKEKQEQKKKDEKEEEKNGIGGEPEGNNV